MTTQPTHELTALERLDLDEFIAAVGCWVAFGFFPFTEVDYAQAGDFTEVNTQIPRTIANSDMPAALICSGAAAITWERS